MKSHGTLFGIGIAILVFISAASIGLDIKSGSDAKQVNRALEVMNRLWEARALIRRAQGAARTFNGSGDHRLADKYRQTRDLIEPAFADLFEMTKDDSQQTELLQSTLELTIRRLALSSEMIRLRIAGDSAAIAAAMARAEGRALMKKVEANFNELTAEEQRQFAVRSTQSQSTERVLLVVDFVGAALILILAAVLLHDAQRTRRRQDQELRTAAATKDLLEATVIERTAHLVAAHGEHRQSMSILRSTFIGMNEAVLVLDTNANILLANPAAERLLGYRPGMSLELLWEELTAYQADGSTAMPRSDMPASRAIRGEQFDSQEVILHRRGYRDPVHVAVSSRNLYDASGQLTGAAVVYHDLTASRETERKLLQSQKLDAIGKLTGGVAHDFNNMLTVITGMTETLVAELQDQPELHHVATLIDQAADRCAELVRRLLAFARKQALRPRDIDINMTIEDIAKLLKPTLGELIEIRLMLEEDIPKAHIDPSQLANAVVNLAINARDAMPDGGKLMLETACVYLDDKYAQDNEELLPGAYVMIAVSDTGTGMPARVLEKIFEPFFTTKEVGKGSGLGLSMVFGFVKQSNGHIKVYSEEGHGTTIKLYLPTAEANSELAVPSLVPVSKGTETVLVVEDDALVRNFVVGQLQGLGYRTFAAADGRTALAHVDSDQSFDLLFTDVIIPGGMTGRQLADEVLRRRPGMKVLYTSGYTENAVVHHGRLDEGVFLLAKPYRKSVLAQMVRQALAGEAAQVSSG